MYVLLFIISVSLFIYSISKIVKSLENISLDYLNSILIHSSKYKYIAIFYGICITAFLQSSSLVTILVISFVGSKKMKLLQATWILMGANIGTTFTNHLITFDLRLFIPTCLCFGIFLLYFTTNKDLSFIFINIGILIISLDLIKIAVTPLHTYEPFMILLKSLENPITALLFGLLMTAILQSSSTSIAILQTVFFFIPIDMTMIWYLLFGQNIGTCFTGAIASIRLNNEAKKVVVISFMINIFGMFLFILFLAFIDFNQILLSFNNYNNAVLIANMNSFYNVLSIIILLPFDIFLVNLTNSIIK